MKVALCLRGISTEFEKSFNNINENIIKDLRKTHTVDIFLNTYENQNNNLLIEKFNPVKTLFKPFKHVESAMHSLVSHQILETCEMVPKDGVYDVIIVTRFDLSFNNKFSEYSIDYDKINMECMFVPDYNSGDNFILFHTKYFNHVKSSIQLTIEQGEHSHRLYTNFRDVECHYIGGETSKRNPHYDVMFRFTRYLL